MQNTQASVTTSQDTGDSDKVSYPNNRKVTTFTFPKSSMPQVL